MILAKDIRKEFAGQDVLRGINLSVDENDFVVILGASGSGKSTLLNILSGLEKSDSGEVLYNGENISNYTETKLTEFRRKNIGFVFQQYYLLNNLTVFQNVRVGANLTNNSDCSEILKELGLEDKVEKYPNELSGGMRQRIAIVLVLCTDAKIVLADEPTTSLDVVNQFKFIELLKKISEEKGLTLIYVSHDIKVLSKICERIIVLKDGNIIEENSTVQILKEPKNDYTKLLIKAATAD